MGENLREEARAAGGDEGLADRDIRTVVPRDVAGVKVLGAGPTPYGGQDSGKLDDALDFVHGSRELTSWSRSRGWPVWASWRLALS